MKLYWFEKGEGYLSGIKDLPKTFSASTIGTGLIAAIFGISVQAVFIQAAQQANWPQEAIVGWICGVWLLMGVYGWTLSLYYKQPIAGAASIPGGILFAAAATNFSINALFGAAVVAGIIVLILGVTGSIKKVMSYLPMPVVLGMTAGVLFRFVTAIPGAIQAAPIIAGVAFVGYLITARWLKIIPPALGGLIFGVVALFFAGSPDFSKVELALSLPPIISPEFNLGAIISVGVPLAVLVVGAENAQAIGVLTAERYKVPINGMTIYSGIGGTIGAFFSAHNLNIAGPMTAMCASSDAGPKEQRYGAAFWNGLFTSIGGALALTMVGFFAAIPKPLLSIIAGLAMIKVVSSSIRDAFKEGKFLLGGFFAFIIGASNITVFNIGAAFWALLGGCLISMILEGKEYKEFVQEEVAKSA